MTRQLKSENDVTMRWFHLNRPILAYGRR